MEIEGARKNCDVTRWGQFTDIKDIKEEEKKRRLRASRCTLRSGLIYFYHRVRTDRGTEVYQGAHHRATSGESGDRVRKTNERSVLICVLYFRPCRAPAIGLSGVTTRK